MSSLNAAMTSNQFYVFAAFGFIIFLMLIFMILMKMDISDMQRRYRKMMVGASGENFETLFTRHSGTVTQVADEQTRMLGDLQRMDNLLEKAITRVAVVKFNAFDDTSAEMSFCIALLDESNSGVIISTINGREESRNYAKEIVNGSPTQYKLTKEEEQALRNATGGKPIIRKGGR